ADVAWRNALALLGDSVKDERLPRPEPDSVDVFLFVDRGFVGHRAEQSISLWLRGEEVGRLRSDDDEARAGVATMIAARIVEAADAPGNDGYRPLQVAAHEEDEHVVEDGSDAGDGCDSPCSAIAEDTATLGHDSGSATLVSESRPGRASGTRRSDRRDRRDESRDMPYLMRIAWPVFRDVSPPLGSVRVLTDSATSHTPLVRASVSSAVAEDLRRDRAMLVARAVARAAAKLAITRGIEEEIREKDEGAADFFAMLGNAAFAVTEQADTRSWTLLPGTVEIARVRVPAGGATVRVEVSGREVTVPVDAPGGSIRIQHVRLCLSTCRLTVLTTETTESTELSVPRGDKGPVHRRRMPLAHLPPCRSQQLSPGGQHAEGLEQQGRAQVRAHQGKRTGARCVDEAGEGDRRADGEPGPARVGAYAEPDNAGDGQSEPQLRGSVGGGAAEHRERPEDRGSQQDEEERADRRDSRAPLMRCR